MADIPKSWNTWANQPESKNIIKEGQHLKISDELAGELATAVSQLENKIPETIDMDVHEYVETKKYLQHAPEDFKKLWSKSSEEDKEIYKKHVEFTVDRINIIGKSGKKYELAKENLTVLKKDLKKWDIDQYKWETYFRWGTLKNYTDKNNIALPTDTDYLDMLQVMPEWDVKEKSVWWRWWSQLFCILWGKSSGSLFNGLYHNGGYWSLWSGSLDDNDYAFALTADDRKGVLKYSSCDLQFPARSLMTQK